ncbi:putative transport protein YifK [compost metagenome]
MWLWPLSSYLALAFLILVVGLMAYFEETRVALYVGPAFLVLLTVLFYTFKLSAKQDSATLARSAS